MENITESRVLDIITGILPWDVPDWLAFMIVGFALVLILYTIVRVGDMIFKIVFSIAIVILIYLLVTGQLSFPLFSYFKPEIQTTCRFLMTL
jgi:hypothetical protein